MSTNTRKHRLVLIASAFLLGSPIAGCGHGSTAKPASSDGNLQQALAYAQCMRANGVPNFPDPQKRGNGVNVDVPKNAPNLNKALAACRDKMPQGAAEGPDGGRVDSAKLAAWATCMRAKLPKFPDPDVSGSTFTITLKGTGINGGSAAFENARKSCESQVPNGSMRVVD